MSDYGYVLEGRVFTPNQTAVSLAECEARNKALEAAELEQWATCPDDFAAYVSNDRRVTTWLGTQIGRVVALTTYRNGLTGSRMDCVTVRGTNGATYRGRYGSDWSQCVRLRRAKA